MQTKIALAGALAFFTASHAQAQQPPQLFIDKGACPFECCTYGIWKATKATTVHSAPDASSPEVGKIRAGETVKASTGEVHVEPGKFIVRRAHEAYKPGDSLWVYTYLGEGMFKVWFRGKMYEQDLGFQGCEDTERCWGQFASDPVSAWWVQVKTKSGKIGWTSHADHFSGKDRCG